MFRYEPATPRVALSLAALAMTAVTIGFLVVLPSTGFAPEQLISLPVAEAVTPGFAEATIRPACVDPAAAQAGPASPSHAANGPAGPDARPL